MENVDTSDLDVFLKKQNVFYEVKYFMESEYLHKEDEYIQYILFPSFRSSEDEDKKNYYLYISIDVVSLVICTDKPQNVVTFEYDNIYSMVVFEENQKWENIDKKELFRVISKYLTKKIE